MGTWTRSSYCESNACVEVTWNKSSYCRNATCVEIGHTEDEVLMRDSKDPEGPVLRFTRSQWQEFVQSLKD